jgi:hypothetical protein
VAIAENINKSQMMPGRSLDFSREKARRTVAIAVGGLQLRKYCSHAKPGAILRPSRFFSLLLAKEFSKTQWRRRFFQSSNKNPC